MRTLLPIIAAFLTACTPPAPPATREDSPRIQSTPEATDAAQLDSGRVTGCHDGDTIKVLLDGKETSIRLEGIDSPELGQPYGRNSKEALSGLIFGKVVTVKETGKPDRYGRKIARIFVDGADVNLAMVQQGFAWHFTTYSKERALADAEKEARTEKRGLWTAPDPVAPWEWRKSERVNRVIKNR